MKEKQLFSIFPDLEEILVSQPELRSSFDLMISNKLEGSMVRYLQGCSGSSLINFLKELKKINPSRIIAHRHALEKQEQEDLGLADVEPVKMTSLDEQKKRSESDRSKGYKALEDGAFASLAFAGGSGTRFFSNLSTLESAQNQSDRDLQTGRFNANEPKGAFPISPVGGLSFFKIIIAQALSVAIETRRLPWVVFLTSSVTHEKTLSFLRSRQLFGFPESGLMAIRQSQEPRLDEMGDLVVSDSQGHLAWTGDGHGGVYRALLATGPDGQSAMSRLRSSGVEHLVMHNVDNAAARPFALSRLGFHIAKNSLFTLSAARKVDPEEKVGVLMRLLKTNRTEVVEYNVIKKELAYAKNPDTGRLLHEAGNINTNLVSLDAVRPDIEPSLYTGKIIGSALGKVSSSSLEMLNQHLTRLLPSDRVFALEVKREEFFMPTKNVTGPDSLVTTRQMMSRRFARMLSVAGARISPHALCDLHPCCCMNTDKMKEMGLGPGLRMEKGSSLYVCAASSTEIGAPLIDGDLTLEPDACLLVDSDLPWGKVNMAPDRRIQLDVNSASKTKIGSNVKIRAGVKVKIKIGPGAKLKIAKGKEFTKDTSIELRSGHELEI